MSEEQETEVATEPATDAPEASTDEPQEDEGKGFVDFSPEAEKRFKRIYGHMKQNERIIEQMTADQRALMEKLTKLEETSYENKTETQASKLKVLKKEAYEAGDIDKVMEIDEQLMKLRTPPARDEPKQQAQEQVGPTPQQAAAIQAWASEKDGEGKQLRPWTDPSHPQYKKAERTLANISQDEEFMGADIEDILSECDRLMGTTKTERPSAAVLSGSQVRSSSKKVSLTPEQKIIAQKMGMTEEAYAKAVKKFG